MVTPIQPRAGSWILLVGSHRMNPTMLTAIARLGEGGAVRILDGGNRFNAYTVARAAAGKPEVLNRITVSRAFTCYQVLSLLESTPAIQVPFVVLDLLNTFYDESVQVGERKRLLRVCIAHLERLSGLSASQPAGAPGSIAGETAFNGLTSREGWQRLPALRQDVSLVPLQHAAGGVVSAHPPKVPSPAAVELLEMLQASAADTYFIRPADPPVEPLRLF